ncbi:MAG: YiiX/YebB-like N1pC/P60 family cysteine hydrolase [Pseudomonadales bacterium]
MSILQLVGKRLARYLSQPGKKSSEISLATSPSELSAATLRKGDVLLVEGNSRFSTAVKYLTQSTWSHAALYIGDAMGEPQLGAEPHVLIEADINEGVHTVPFSTYSGLHTRICRPIGLAPDEIDAVIAHAMLRLGHKYDLKNILDLIRYLIQIPPVPGQFRRRLLALGSGDPTQAICSSMIAQAFQSVRYPILPLMTTVPSRVPKARIQEEEILHIRHHSLFTPRDFDISPYFQIVKPTIEQGFDFHTLKWGDAESENNNPDIKN